jgi:[protein-PII] uridylyltransferase
MPQRNALHTFTVDRHQVEAAVRAAALTRRVARPDLLVTAALLHDIGKGGPRDHSEVGAEIVAELAPRLGFSAADAAVLVALVRHHLTLADLATHRDPGDPATVAALVAATGDQETLDLLHALTEADALATGPAAWGSWRARLVADLVRRASASFAGKRPEPSQDTAKLAEAMNRCREMPDTLLVTVENAAGGARVITAMPDRHGGLALIAGVLALQRVHVRAAAVASGDGYAAAIWDARVDRGAAPEAERLRTALRAALSGTLDLDARLAARDAADRPRRGLPAPAPTATAIPGASADATVIDVRARDTVGLLYRIAWALTGYDAGGRGVGNGIVEVRSARVATLAGEAVDTFYVVDARSGKPFDEADARALARHVRQVLGGG